MDERSAFGADAESLVVSLADRPAGLYCARATAGSAPRHADDEPTSPREEPV